MSDKLKIQRVSSDNFFLVLNKILERDDYDIDSNNCGLVSCESQLSESGIEVFNLKNGLKNRYLYCLKVENIEENTILVKDDVYYNITRHLDGDALSDCNLFEYEKAASDYFPSIADTIKVSPVYSSYTLNTGDDEILLNTYFTAPRFLYLNDVFAVSLNDSTNLNKSVMYHDVSEVYFKVVNLQVNELSNSENAYGFYIFKEHSELYCMPPISSLIPPKGFSLLASLDNFQFLSVPPCLVAYVTQLQKLISPFTKLPKPDCIPFFLLSGINGSGKLETLKIAVESTGYHILIINCYELYGIGVSAIEAKLDYIVDKASKIGACVIAFTDFELIGKDKSGNEDARLVNSFLQRIALILSNKATYSTIIFGITDVKSENIISNISRAIIHTIKFQTSTPETSVKTVVWLALQKGFTIQENCSEFLTKQLSGFVYADLILLVKHVIRFLLEEDSNKKELTLTHLKQGLEIMDAAYSDAIGAAKVPSVRWDDVGGLVELKKEIVLTLNLPLQRADILGGSLRRSGILFYGPPGTGKTLMAKAVATECSMNFLSVKGPELMNMYVGQSERNVREVFERGRAAAPCILFFDELDSLAPNRGKSGDSGGVADRVVSQLLAEMDGLQSNRGLFVIAATNRPDLVDPALLRPGRFDKMFYLGPCADSNSKTSVLHAVINKFELASDVNVDTVVSLLPSLVTGADIYSVCSNAWLSAARRSIKQKVEGQPVKLPLEVTLNDFKEGVKAMVPSLTSDDLHYYDQLAASAKGSH